MLCLESCEVGYSAVVRQVFGAYPPTDFTEAPTFSREKTLMISMYYITPAGQKALQRLLWVFQEFVPQVKFCPVLPSLCSLMLAFLPEEEVFAAVVFLVKLSLKATSKDLMSWHLPLSDLMWQQLAEACTQSLAGEMPRLIQHLKLIKFDLNAFLSELWGDFFISVLDFEVLLRIYSCFLSEGFSVLFRVTAVLLSLAQTDLFTLNLPADVTQLIRGKASTLHDPEFVIKLAFKLNLTMPSIDCSLQTQSSFTPLALSLGPQFSLETEIINSSQLHLIPKQFSEVHRRLTPKLVFCSTVDGMSMNTLLLKCAEGPDYTPCLLLVKTDEYEVIGLFLDARIRHTRGAVIGGSNSFVFTLAHSPPGSVQSTPPAPLIPRSPGLILERVPEVRSESAAFYKYTGRNDYVFSVSDNILIIGSGGEGAALTLDSALLHGFTHSSETFGNAPLGRLTFKVLVVEVLMFN
jgi:hypothetical protein